MPDFQESVLLHPNRKRTQRRMWIGIAIFLYAISAPAFLGQTDELLVDRVFLWLIGMGIFILLAYLFMTTGEWISQRIYSAPVQLRVQGDQLTVQANGFPQTYVFRPEEIAWRPVRANPDERAAGAGKKVIYLQLRIRLNRFLKGYAPLRCGLTPELYEKWWTFLEGDS